ncbi:hypothetical protein MMC28_008728 [Mycoblastus sanguinarius]|nr:hypothetical protein [Mycoblastus sanguinarius]
MPTTSSREEEQPLLADEEQVDQHGSLLPPNPYADLPVYHTIHRVRQEVIASIDDPYSLEQLRAPRINVAIVRPLVSRLWELRDVSLAYCLLVNKLQFLREQSFQAHQTINTTRALLCELVVQKIIRRTDEENPGHDGLLLLSNIMVAGFEPFQNAPDNVVRQNRHAVHWMVQKRGGYERKSTFLEMAIISESKMALSSLSCQKVMEAIYKGQVVYTPSTFLDLIPDYYKHRPISLYYPSKAPLLDQYRLTVPRTRNTLDIFQFIVLLILYILTMENRRSLDYTNYELVFCIYASGWVLEQFASILEHGWKCYTQNLWAFLDTIFATIYGVYFVLRIYYLATGDPQSGRPALGILSAAAPVLIPRLAFNLLSENMLFVSLRAMMKDFAVLTLLAVWCFAGFLLSMTWLGRANHETKEHTSITISKWMLWVWFGLDGTGIQKSVDFHWLIGPILMVTFAFLGNTLFLTILVSMLSSTFSNIASNATAEIQFRRAVLTFEGVKSDAIFAYQPPFNIAALFLILPLKLVFSPRWFHKINVAVVRTLNAPILLLIGFYERRYLWSALRPKIRSKLAFWDFSRFSVHGDTQAVFDFDPPQIVLDELPEAEDTNGSLESAEVAIGLGGKTGLKPPGGQAGNRKTMRKDSVATMAGLAEHVTDFLEEHGGYTIAGRLEALEESTKRVEAMLLKLGQDLGEDASPSDVEAEVP